MTVFIILMLSLLTLAAVVYPFFRQSPAPAKAVKAKSRKPSPGHEANIEKDKLVKSVALEIRKTPGCVQPRRLS